MPGRISYLANVQESVPSDIYDGIALHQRTSDWYGAPLMTQLQEWVDRFIVEFKLDVHKIVLRVDTLPVRVLSHFRVGHNGFGLEGEVALNALYLTDRPFWQIVGTLCHECLHAWQQVNGTPSRRDHHNTEFRKKAADIGLLVDRHGVTDYLLDSPFMDLLRRNGVEVPIESEEQEPGGSPMRARRIVRGLSRTKGKSTMAKWSCGCTNIRCGRADLQAICMKCSQAFRRAV